MAPEDMARVVAKAASAGNERVTVTERGTSFGYRNLVVDMRSFTLMREAGIPVVGANILIMGVTFKENCPDTRNSQVFRVIAQLKKMNAKVDATDPWVDVDEAADLGLVQTTETGKYDAIVIAVGHKQFTQMGIEQIRNLGNDTCVIFDLKYLLDQQLTDVRL